MSTAKKTAAKKKAAPKPEPTEESCPKIVQIGRTEGGDFPFDEPVVRCDGCNKLVHRAFVSRHGACNHCGNKRFRNVTGLDSEELNRMRVGKYDFGLPKDDCVIDGAFIDDWAPVGAK